MAGGGKVTSVVGAPLGSENLSVKKGGARVNQPGRKIRDFFGTGKSAAGRAGGDPGLHLEGEVGTAETGGYDHFKSGDRRAGGVSAPFFKDSLKGADPGTGREVASRTVVGEGRKEDKEAASGSEMRTQPVDEPGDAGEGGEDLQGIVRGRIGAVEGGVGKDGQAPKGCGLKDAVDLVKLRAIVSRG